MYVLFVSVNESFNPGKTSMAELAIDAAYAWRVSRKNADRCDCVVAVYKGLPVAAWQLVRTFTSEEPWDRTGRVTTRRTGLVLGEAWPIEPRFNCNPALRNGVAYFNID